MSNLDDIAKLAIEEIGAEFDESNPTNNESSNLSSLQAAVNSALDATNANFGGFDILENSGPRPLRAANDKVAPVAQNKEIKAAFETASARHATAQNISNQALVAQSSALNEAAAKSVEHNPLLNSPEQENVLASSDKAEQIAYLNRLKERIEVLFAGLNSSDDNLALRLDLTVRFLEFLLAHTNKRLESLQE